MIFEPAPACMLSLLSIGDLHSGALLSRDVQLCTFAAHVDPVQLFNLSKGICV